MSGKILLGMAHEFTLNQLISQVLRELSGLVMILPIELLRPHEQTSKGLVDQLAEEIERDGFLRKAILVDRETLTVLDGHHRIEALRKLRCRKIPCLLIDYLSPRIEVRGGSGEKSILKEQVVEAGIRGRLMPPKTTRHLVLVGGKVLHVSEIEPDLNVPLHDLL